jgi:hypothetical protein
VNIAALTIHVDHIAPGLTAGDSINTYPTPTQGDTRLISRPSRDRGDDCRSRVPGYECRNGLSDLRISG